METLKFDLSKRNGEFKAMNAVNNGPVYKKHSPGDQQRSNLESYTAARIPYARNHDAAFQGIYGGEHTVDISAVFPDFNANPYAPDSYNFACTDEYLEVIEMAGTKTFYRLGQKIEHYVKKYDIIPPADFKKWAIVCEHIIKHYNEGWANGYEMGIEYWEIWNEPDLDAYNPNDKRTWTGTKFQFFDFYETAAKHLKKVFPDLKIGGPAIAHDLEWADEFLGEMSKRDVPMDFFSWHKYCVEPADIIEFSQRVDKLLEKHGYEDAESILNEWNYVKGWSDEYIDSIKTIISMKGAAFTMACMAEAQKSTIDMLMYYDARPCVFNGLFDFYTFKPLKTYYSIAWFSDLYDKEEVVCKSNPENIYTLCGVANDGKVLAIVTYYSDKENLPEKEINVDFGKDGKYEIYLLDENNDGTLMDTTSDLCINMQQNTCVMIKEI